MKVRPYENGLAGEEEVEEIFKVLFVKENVDLGVEKQKERGSRC
ncbi:probable sodium-coupled neutral amino acid transporter 6 isoform X12 [Prionailurus iriomotensis]